MGQNLERLRSQSEELLLVIEDEIRYIAKGRYDFGLDWKERGGGGMYMHVHNLARQHGSTPPPLSYLVYNTSNPQQKQPTPTPILLLLFHHHHHHHQAGSPRPPCGTWARW